MAELQRLGQDAEDGGESVRWAVRGLTKTRVKTKGGCAEALDILSKR